MDRPIHHSSDTRTYVSDEESVVSDCESGVSGDEGTFSGAFVPAAEDGRHVRTRFVRSLALNGLRPEVLTIAKNAHSSVLARARAQCFQISARAVAELHGGHANVRFAWYGASGKEEIADIAQHGFGHAHCNGLRLSPLDCPLQSVKRSGVDSDGVRYLLLCSVILGKTEVVPHGSNQRRSSSEEYDSGVDDLLAPKEYVIWCNRINTHVLPEYVLSFTLPSLKGNVNIGEPLRPSSPWMPFPALVSVLSRILPADQVAIIVKIRKDYTELKISRHEMIQRVRNIAGDKLLVSIIRSFRAKKTPASSKANKGKQGPGERRARGQPVA
ncbi:probable inactive poly [ADP-ribose] polymerase SRO5 [Vigna unguiculata]|uniref:probable inactive poly [ADP-ribose] polymerase SRO5 n=1 Tax=Vigna unguiculata TaxID=3917 RepID=UPI00101655D0|nr:probable inactive poly [ADP-ribose] polymerase SRO5 [Vigna unguiculata]